MILSLTIALAMGQCQNGRCRTMPAYIHAQPVMIVPQPVQAPVPLNNGVVNPPPTEQAKPEPKCPCQCDPCTCRDCKYLPKPADAVPSPVKRDPASTAGQPAQPQESPPITNYGLNSEELQRDKADRPSAYSENGRPCSKAQAFHAMGDGAIPDDSTHLRLTAIGSKEQTAAIEADVKAMFAGMNVTFQCYNNPSDPMIAELGFAPGSPSVYLQSPDGTVLARWDVYNKESVASELRKRQPNYDPNKDNQPLKNPLPISLPENAGLYALIAIIAAIFGLNLRK